MTEQSGKHPYGSIRDAVNEWVDLFPAGKEFHYGDIAADLGVQLPTISSVMLKLVRADNPVVQRGKKVGWYVKPDPRAATPAQAPNPEPREVKPDDLLEVVGKYKNGNILLRWPDDGSLWEAKAL